MREDENDGGHPSSEGSDSRRRIATKREPEMSNRAPMNSTSRGSWVRQVAQAMEEQLKEDHQEQTREHQKKVEDAKRICRMVHENDKSKG